jgi:hypothetical protein
VRSRTAALLAALAALAAGSAQAAASPVVVLDGRHAERHDDPHLPAADLPPAAPASGRAHARPRGAASARGRRALRSAAAHPTVRGELARLLAEGAIDQAAHDARRATYNRARKAYKKLTGARRAELGGALANVEAVAATGQLTPSRLAPLFLTIDRNREWWTTGPLLRSGQRVEFEGSELVWQHYPGQGLQIQVLANFGKANALWADGRDADLRALLDELVSLASDRGGVLAWEYGFRFDGGEPPWTSGMSQGTAVQALARAADRLGEPAYRDLALRALALFETPPPQGVRVDDALGPHYLLYSFAPDLRVLNGFLQAVIGLSDAAQLTADPRARLLAESGDAEARREVPLYDTGAWSLYSLERESDLSYHRLVRDFLARLCDRTAAPVYCDTATRFTGYLDVPPIVRALRSRLRARRAGRLRLKLSKISRVTLTVLDGERTVLRRTATVGRGKRFLEWTPTTAGTFELRVAATDLAGNRAEKESSAEVEVLPAKRRRKPAAR